MKETGLREEWRRVLEEERERRRDKEVEIVMLKERLQTYELNEVWRVGPSTTV